MYNLVELLQCIYVDLVESLATFSLLFAFIVHRSGRRATLYPTKETTNGKVTEEHLVLQKSGKGHPPNFVTHPKALPVLPLVPALVQLHQITHS